MKINLKQLKSSLIIITQKNRGINVKPIDIYYAAIINIVAKEQLVKLTCRIDGECGSRSGCDDVNT